MTSKGVGIETLLNPEMGSKRLIVERLTIEEGKSYRRVAEGEEGFYYVATGGGTFIFHENTAGWKLSADTYDVLWVPVGAEVEVMNIGDGPMRVIRFSIKLTDEELAKAKADPGCFKWFNVWDMPLDDIGTFLSRMVFYSPSVKSQAIEHSEWETLQTGGYFPTHKHRADQVFYMTKGELVSYIGPEKKKVVHRAGELVFYPAGVPHYSINESDDKCEFLECSG